MIIIMGMPGAGKSVQSELIRERLGFHWLSTGELLRGSNDPEINEIMASGALVDDEHIFKVVANKIADEGTDSTFLLDGFPRNVKQAEWLLTHSGDINKTIKLIMYLVVDEEVASERLGDRGRDDDTSAALLRRQEEVKKLEPTLHLLRKADLPVVEINANSSVEDIFSQIKEELAKHGIVTGQ